MWAVEEVENDSFLAGRWFSRSCQCFVFLVSTRRQDLLPTGMRKTLNPKRAVKPWMDPAAGVRPGAKRRRQQCLGFGFRVAGNEGMAPSSSPYVMSNKVVVSMFFLIPSFLGNGG